MPFTNAYALVVGIANYERIKKLPPTVLKDAQDIYDLLINPHIAATCQTTCTI